MAAGLVSELSPLREREREGGKRGREREGGSTSGLEPIPGAPIALALGAFPPLPPSHFDLSFLSFKALLCARNLKLCLCLYDSVCVCVCVCFVCVVCVCVCVCLCVCAEIALVDNGNQNVCRDKICLYALQVCSQGPIGILQVPKTEMWRGRGNEEGTRGHRSRV